MAVCRRCGQEMLTSDGCVDTHVEVSDVVYERIRAEPEGERCHDCGAKAGMLHHPHCDMEVCPVCRGQLLSCEHQAAILRGA